MTKRVIIAGCRDYSNYDDAKKFIDNCLCDIQKIFKVIIISGGAKGADSIGERYAIENNLEIERYPAEWSIYGKKSRTDTKSKNGGSLRLCNLFLGRQK